jgi:polysaccharide export outer membrane protein
LFVFRDNKMHTNNNSTTRVRAIASGNLRSAILLLLIGIPWFGVACAAQPPAAQPSVAKARASQPAAQPRAQQPPETGGDYEIGPEDVLGISVWKEQDLQREVLVRPDGWITFPLVGNLKAAGRTAYELEQEIRLKLRKFIPDPVVTVSVLKIQGLKIFVLGRVGKPGEYMVGRYVDVLQALTLAGGLTPFAKESQIKIVRKQDNKEVVIPFDYSEVKHGRQLNQNIKLKSGDTIIVP